MNNISKDFECAKLIAKKVNEIGGNTYFVGGYVRDRILKIDNKDIDIEVHGISPKQLESILDSIGSRIEIGESFGIYNLKGYTIDIAMPRKESVIGGGHKDFDILVDPYMGTYKAAKRRDFTINALMEDVLSGEIVDHFNGIDDLNNKIIRYVNEESFQEDPLRVLRACQFASRFEFNISNETIKLCKSMDLSMLSKERIEKELQKALLKAKKPSIFFECLRKMNQLQYWFKEVYQLIGVEQSKIHHLEGDVWTHTMMVVDQGAIYKEYVDNQYGFMMSCLCHDFGKIICTKEIDGKIRAFGHETEGLPLVKSFIKKITNETKLLEYVLNMTELHMKPNILASSSASIKATNKMFDKAIDPKGLIYISICDSLGKKANYEPVRNDKFLFERIDIYNEYMSRPYVSGKDLIDSGLIPDKNFKDILEYAHKLRLAGVDKESALKQTLAYSKNK